MRSPPIGFFSTIFFVLFTSFPAKVMLLYFYYLAGFACRFAVAFVVLLRVSIAVKMEREEVCYVL